MQITASATLQHNSIAVHKILLHRKVCRDLVLLAVLSRNTKVSFCYFRMQLYLESINNGMTDHQGWVSRFTPTLLQAIHQVQGYPKKQLRKIEAVMIMEQEFLESKIKSKNFSIKIIDHSLLNGTSVNLGELNINRQLIKYHCF